MDIPSWKSGIDVTTANYFFTFLIIFVVFNSLLLINLRNKNLRIFYATVWAVKLYLRKSTFFNCEDIHYTAYRIRSRMIIYLTDEDSDDMQRQFFHPSGNRLSTRSFTDQWLYATFYDYTCGALFMQSILRRIFKYT